MKLRSLLSLLILVPALALAQDSLVHRVQERLVELGFYEGPVNGELSGETQAALARFQQSVPIPAGGQLDELTLSELGVAREAAAPEASAGTTADPGTAVAPNTQ